MKIGKGSRVIISDDPAAGVTRLKDYKGRKGVVTRISMTGGQAYVKLARQGRETADPHHPWSLGCLSLQDAATA